MLGQSNFSPFTGRITRDEFEFEETRASAYRYPVFEMGEYTGELPSNFISFNFLENKANELKGSNTEGTNNFQDLLHRSESKTVIIEETETPQTKSLAVLQVAAAKESTVRKSEDANEERVIFRNQECVLSSGDEDSERLEKFCLMNLTH